MTLSNMVAQAHIPVWMTFLLINLVLLFLGCFVGMANLLLITTPIFLPLCVSLGMDPIQYGAMCVLNLGIGLMTPPVGAALNAAYVVSGIPIEKISVSLLPWWGIMFATLMLVTYVPAISMFLPNMMM
jgi:TRAP-type C4-dicarboxylate transport system permease large subunit